MIRIKATRLGDIGGAHDECPPRPIISASNNVFINGKRAARQGDALDLHGCPIHLPHPGSIADGSRTVFINSKRAARVGDAVDCGGSVLQGSPNVFIGG